MSLLDIYKTKKFGIGTGSLFATSLGKRMKTFAEFNKWDEEWELGIYNNDTGEKQANNSVIRAKNKIAILPSTTYYFKSPSNSRFFYYDADGAYVSTVTRSANYTFTTPNNAHYMTFQVGGTTYNNDICININKTTGTPKNGDYVPYKG